MIWCDIIDVQKNPYVVRICCYNNVLFIIDKAPEPHDGRVVLHLNDFQPIVFTNRLNVFTHDSLLPC